MLQLVFDGKLYDLNVLLEVILCFPDMHLQHLHSAVPHGDEAPLRGREVGMVTAEEDFGGFVVFLSFALTNLSEIFLFLL